MEIGAYNPTDVNRLENENVISVYQSNNTLTVYSSEPINSISLFDMKGQMIQKINNVNNTIQQINTDFSTGVYLMKIDLINGESQTDKIVIR